MILFVAPNPFKVKEREGYLQRVAAVDAIFPDEEKHYSHDSKSEIQLAKWIIEADLIYVHSIYRAEEIIDCYPVFGKKIITDFHGVVPEEEAMVGEKRRSDELNTVEEKVLKHGSTFVAVTNAMVQHFKNKYPENRGKRWITLPIFEPVHEVPKMHKFNHRIIYAGGAQKWQNTEAIVTAINKSNEEYSYDILTHSPEAFDGIKSRDKVNIETVASSKVGQYYKKADLGFILRDDNVVNTVACPTKMIEYLGYGVIPIVMTPYIGDFYELGYRYITLSEFTSNNFSIDALKGFVEDNYEVVKKLEELTRVGKLKLVKTAGLIKSNPKKQPTSTDILSLVASACNNSKNNRDLKAKEYQINVQIKMISEYGAAVEYYRKQEANQSKYSKLIGRTLRTLGDKGRKKDYN